MQSNLTAFDGEFLFTKSSEDVNLYLQVCAIIIHSVYYRQFSIF